MKYLFLLISFLYSFGFYVFYVLSQNKNILLKDLEEKKNILNTSVFDSQILSSPDMIIFQSFFWDLRIEAIAFFLIWIFLFFYFWATQEEKEDVKEEKKSFLTKQLILFFLKKFSYYIGFILFYIALFLVSKGFHFIDFSGFIFGVSLVIFIFFFASKYSKISLDFLKINSFCFSLVYIFQYIFIMISGNNTFWILDSINSLFIILTFIILLYVDKNIHHKKTFDYSLMAHLSVYVFFVVLFYLSIFFVDKNLLYWMVFISTFFGIIWFEILPKLKIFTSQIVVLRYIGILFSYFWIFLWILFLFLQESRMIIALLIFQAAYHLFIHKKYINIISYAIAFFVGIFCLNYTLLSFEIFLLWDFGYFIFLLLLSYIWVGGSYFFKTKTSFDRYVIHIFSHILNIFAVFLFFYFHYKDFELFHIWLLLLWESLYFFASYYKLQKKNKLFLK